MTPRRRAKAEILPIEDWAPYRCTSEATSLFHQDERTLLSSVNACGPLRRQDRTLLRSAYRKQGCASRSAPARAWMRASRALDGLAPPSIAPPTVCSIHRQSLRATATACAAALREVEPCRRTRPGEADAR